MSQTHTKKQKQSPERIVWWKIAYLPAGVLMLFLTVYLIANWIHSSTETYITTNGKILEIRKVVDSTRETFYGGKIFYRIEVHVQYTVKGQMQDRWLSASDGLTYERADLKLATHPTECLIYWHPNHPENAKCSLK